MSWQQPMLTRRQVREVHTTVRHLGRAMASINRASLPSPPKGVCPSWLCALYDAERALSEASNRMIDGLEAMDAIPGPVQPNTERSET